MTRGSLLIAGMSVLFGCRADAPGFALGNASAAPGDAPEGWTLDVLRERGGAGASEPWQFVNPLIVITEGPNGQILLLERSGNRLMALDREGRFVRTIGGVGPGPGEFSSPYAAGVHASGNIWVSESFQGYYHVFDSLGVFRHTVPRQMRSVSPYGAPLRFDADGRILDIEARGTEFTVVRIDPENGTSVGRGPSMEVPPPPPAFGILLPNSAHREVARHLLPRLRWAMTEDGGLWSALSTGGTVEWLRPDGAVGRTLVLPNAARGFTSEEEELVERAKRELRTTDVGARPQTVQGIIPLPDGRVLVQVPEPLNEPGTRFELFGPDDRWMGTVQAEVALHPRTSPLVLGDTIIGITLDSLDVPVLVWTVLRGRGR